LIILFRIRISDAMKKGTVLIVDDDRDVLLSARVVMKKEFPVVLVTTDPEKIPEILKKEEVDVILLDMNFRAGESDGEEGMRWLRNIHAADPDIQVVVITAYGDINLAVAAMKEGACDFVVKPWDNQKLLATVRSCYRYREAGREIRRLENTRRAIQGDVPGQMIGVSKPMQNLFDMVEKVAPTDASVLITGENGTGKELVARRLHHLSHRSNQIFLTVDLGALSENLFESELFGHVRGAFTDAREDRPGKFEVASGGTLFLDEIGNLSVPMQAKMLTALQNRQVYRVGSNRPLEFDVRLISATNRPLQEMVKNGRFRQDLLYRINTVVIHVPPLRQRKEDIPLLVNHFTGVYGQKYNKTGLHVNSDDMKRLENYSWPGNVRELQHMVERAVILADRNTLDFSGVKRQPASPVATMTESLNLEELERQAIAEAIRKHGGNMSRAAAELGLGRTTLYRKMEKYGL